ALDAAALGQRTIEHANRLVFDAAEHGDTLRLAMARALHGGTRAARFAILAEAIDQFDTVRVRRLAIALASKHVAVTPTLVSARRLAFRNDSAFDTDPRLR